MEPQTEPRRRRRPVQPVIIEEPEQEVVVQPTPAQEAPVNAFLEVTNPDDSVKTEQKTVKTRKVKKVKPKKVKAKRSLCQFLSAAILIAYTIFVVQYFFDVSVNQMGESVAENLGRGIATMMVTPHMLLCAIASVFSAAGFIANSRGFALTAAILECVAAIVFLMYAPFLIPSIVLGFIGYVRIGSLKKKSRRYTE